MARINNYERLQTNVNEIQSLIVIVVVILFPTNIKNDNKQ